MCVCVPLFSPPPSWWPFTQAHAPPPGQLAHLPLDAVQRHNALGHSWVPADAEDTAGITSRSSSMNSGESGRCRLVRGHTALHHGRPLRRCATH